MTAKEWMQSIWEEMFREPQTTIVGMMILCLVAVVCLIYAFRAYRRAQRGFTLVEMLVVIGIMALMAGILFPAFKGIRDNVKKHQCQANLRDIYHALRMYEADWGCYPESLLWLHSRVLDELAGTTTPVDPAQVYSLLEQKGLYLTSARIFHCPADTHHEKPVEERDGRYYIDPYYFTYAVPLPDDLLAPYFSVILPYYQDLPEVVQCIPRWAVPYVRRRMPLRDELRLSPDDPRRPFLEYISQKQLYAKEPFASTVITWCTAHRDLDQNGQPRSGSKDIVLFIDGHTEVRETSEMLREMIDGYPAAWRIEPRR